MLNEVVRLSSVINLRQHLEVVCAVQPADDPAAQGHDVIDFMGYSCRSRKLGRQSVHGGDSLVVGPLGRGFQLRGFTAGAIGSSFVRVSLNPSLKIARSAFAELRVAGVQLAGVLAAVVLVAFVPLLQAFRIVGLPLSRALSFQFLHGRGLRFRAGAAHRLTARVELGSRLIRSARKAMAVSHRRHLFLVDASSLLGVCREVFLVGRSPCLHRFCHRIFLVKVSKWSMSSMCLSTIRRTSSAMDMPRRFASRFRYDLCGSVKEIICLVMRLAFPTRVSVLPSSCRPKRAGYLRRYVRVRQNKAQNAGTQSNLVGLCSFTNTAVHLQTAKKFCHTFQFEFIKALSHGLSIPQGIPMENA